MSRWGVARAKLDEGDLVPEDADFPKEKVTSQKILELFGTAGTTQTMKMLQERRSRRRRNSCYSIDPSLLERPGRIQELHSMEQFQMALKSANDALVCVTYSAKWCGPWRMIKPDVHRLSHIHGDVIFYEIDVDENEEIALARRVACMPTFQFFKCGVMLDKFAEPNRIKLDETIRKLRKMEMRPED